MNVLDLWNGNERKLRLFLSPIFLHPIMLHESWGKQAEKQQDHTSKPDVEVHLQSSVLASLVRFPDSSRSTLCEGLLFGTRVSRKPIIAASDSSSGDDMHACAVPSVLISRAHCTGTSQSFYNGEGDVNPEYVKAKEQQVGLEVVGWFVYRQKNTNFCLFSKFRKKKIEIEIKKNKVEYNLNS